MMTCKHCLQGQLETSLNWTQCQASISQPVQQLNLVPS